MVSDPSPLAPLEAVVRDLEWEWPDQVFSLSHVALPFSIRDPLYGDGGEESPGIHIGSVALRGEHGVLQIPAAAGQYLSHLFVVRGVRQKRT